MISSFSLLNGQASDFCGFESSTTTSGGGHPICELYGEVVTKYPDANSEVEIYYIPVVIHVIHDNGPEKISESEAEGLISELNVRFAGAGPNSHDPKIEFFLAKVDPENNCTNGIFFSEPTPLTNASLISILDNSPDPVKNINMWDPTKYFNIWLVKNIGDNVRGYSSFPFVAQSGKEGVVFEYNAGSRFLAHEVGHFLGLFHLNGCGGCEQGCGATLASSMVLNDYVEDTNPAFSNEGGNCFDGCPPNEGVNPFPNLPFMDENFMASGNFFMSFRTFTAKQIKRMYYYLNTTYLRSVWYPGYIIKKEMIVDQETKFHKDVNIYDGGILRIEAEAIMAEGTSIIVHQGGQLVVNGGKIRACSISETERSKWNGVSILGRNQDGYDVEFNGATIEDVDGYAVSTIGLSPFMFPGNGKLLSRRTIFNNVDGLANLAAFKPVPNNSIVDFCIQNGGEYGVSSGNGLDISIMDSKFYDITNTCVKTTGGSFLIERNEFHGDQVDVALTHISKGEPSTIRDNNEFRGKLFGIRAAGSTSGNHIIEENTFYGQVYDPDVNISYADVDIYMDGITDYTIDDNTFRGLIGVSSRATVNTTGLDNINNNVKSNEFQGNNTGIYPHDSNTNYAFTDNCFSTRIMDARIVGAMADQGQQGGVPTNNCFTHQGEPSANGYTVIDIGGDPDVFKYIETTVPKFDCRNAFLAHPNVNRLPTNLGENIECSENGGGRARAYGSTTSNSLYNEYENISMLVNQNDFQAARTQLAQIDQYGEEGVDLYMIAENLIELFENPNDNNVLNNPVLIQNLETIAMKEMPTSGYAQAFHYYLTGEFVDNLDLSFLDEENVNERNSDLQKKTVVSKEVSIYPNPATDLVRIKNSEKINKIRVYNLFGDVVFESGESDFINTTKWVQGIYLMEILKNDGDTLTKKVIINK